MFDISLLHICNLQKVSSYLKACPIVGFVEVNFIISMWLQEF